MQPTFVQQNLVNSQMIGTLSTSHRVLTIVNQMHGKAEAAVEFCKSIIKKARKTTTNLWQAVLEWRNPPTPGMSWSPVQRLMSRRTRTMLPCTPSLFKPVVIENVLEDIMLKRQKAKKCYDRRARPLPELVVGQPVRAKINPKSTWQPAVVQENIALRSYIVQSNGRNYRQNSVDIRDALKAKHEHRSDHSVLPSPDATTVSNVTVPSNNNKIRF